VKRNVRQDFYQPKLQLEVKEIERRRRSRFPVNLPAELVNRESKKMVTGMAKNIGIGGCYIDTPDTFPAGTLVDFSLKSEHHTFRTRARVTYFSTFKGLGMGVAFTETDLPDWLERMEGDPGFPAV
jgi:hypothetical protein